MRPAAARARPTPAAPASRPAAAAAPRPRPAAAPAPAAASSRPAAAPAPAARASRPTPAAPPTADASTPPDPVGAEGAPYGCTGCKRLFDGKTLEGWETRGGWVVKEGALASTGAANDIWTKEDIGDARIFFQVRQIKGDHKPCTTLFGTRPAAGAAPSAGSGRAVPAAERRQLELRRRRHLHPADQPGVQRRQLAPVRGPHQGGRLVPRRLLPGRRHALQGRRGAQLEGHREEVPVQHHDAQRWASSMSTARSRIRAEPDRRQLSFPEVTDSAARVADLLELSCLHYGVRPGTRAYAEDYPDRVASRRRAARLLEQHPGIARGSLHAAVVCGDRAEVDRLLALRPAAVSEPGGPRGLGAAALPLLRAPADRGGRRQRRGDRDHAARPRR